MDARRPAVIAFGMRLAPLFLALALGTTAACFQTEAGGLRCEDYCPTIADACSEVDEQYPTDIACQNICSIMESGKEGDAQGNTLGCRMTWALEALEQSGPDLAQTCRWAGPGGDGTCGGVCESLCEYAMQICTGDNQQFASATECITACNSLPEEPPYNTMAEGPNQSCRLYHLTLATASPAEHCPHVGGAGPCAAP